MPHPLDPSRYTPRPEDIQALQKRTGIQDEAEVLKFVYEIQKEAFEIFPYSGIRRFNFLWPGAVDNHRRWNDVLEEAKEKDAIYLDLGCGFGNDIRRAADLGCPVGNIVANDLRKGFWDLAHKLNRDTESLPVPCIGGSIFDNSVFDASAPAQTERPTLTGLTSLTSLKGHITVLHTKMFFHLFPEAEQEDLTQRIHALMSKKPGSMIFGVHSGTPDGLEGSYPNPRGSMRYLHSPQSFKILWERTFGADKIDVDCSFGLADWNWDEEERKVMNSSEAVGPPPGWLTWTVKLIA